MAQVYHKVVKGDTLSEIAVTYGTTVSNLLKLNPHIKDKDMIYVGEEILVTGTPTVEKVNNTQYAIVNRFGLQSGTERTLFATWSWDYKNNPTEHYKVKWRYATGDGIWFIGTTTTTTELVHTYTAPENAYRVDFTVIPISKTKDSKGTKYYQSGWSTQKIYNFSEKAYPPKVPPVPTVTIEDTKLKAELQNLEVEYDAQGRLISAEGIEFQIVRDDKKTILTNVKATIDKTFRTASCQYTVSYGGKYKVRCRSYARGMESDWTDYTSNILTIPYPPNNITEIRATSKTSIYLKWDKVTSGDVKSYDIEYTTEKRYFDGSNQTTTVSGIEQDHYELTGLETGREYFFRVRAVNEKGASSWLPSGRIKSIIIGKPPAAPTTWSSTTTAILGEDIYLYWVHNAEDGSKSTYGQIEMYINGVKDSVDVLGHTGSDDEEEKTNQYLIDVSELPIDIQEGAKITWRVRTAGVTKEWGDWSVQRTIDIYAAPSLELSILQPNNPYSNDITALPFEVVAIAGPNTQRPTGYYLSVISNESYETVDNMGNEKIVNAGDSIYSEHFDGEDTLYMYFDPGNISLENNIEYTLKCIVAMNSGLTAEESKTFRVSWAEGDRTFWPNLEINVDPETYTASIRPYCKDENGEFTPGVSLSLYRREFDGKFTELATGLNNTAGTHVSDPHLALDYARYRVVATDLGTGAISYYDAPGYPVGGIAAILQWDETWTNFDATNDETPAEPSWAGSMLKLPYNIKVSENNRQDVELVEYIGREHPVSYYGTHRGSSSSWSMDVPKDDKETLYALRRLMHWMGDVYVREPSGIGYWANVQVSISQDQKNTVIPVSLSITRVEGGV